jgi:hypothetical protein
MSTRSSCGHCHHPSSLLEPAGVASPRRRCNEPTLPRRTQQIDCVSVHPAVRSGYRVVAGEHIARWDEIRERFGWNLRRRRLLDGLQEGLAALGAVGCSAVWLNGSFVTAKEEPGDFDVVWSPVGVDHAQLRNDAPELLDFSGHRDARKRRFGGELLPNIVEGASGQQFADFFQTDRDETSKGTVVFDPSKATWE